MARKQQKRHNRGSDRRKTAHAHRSTRHMQPVRTQKTVRRRLPEAEVRRRQRARRRQFALLGLAVLLIVLIFAFRHLISTPQQSGADGDTGNSGTSATEEVKQVAKAVNVYQSVMYYQPVVQKYAEQNGIPEYTDVLLAIMQVESGGKLTDIMLCCGFNTIRNFNRAFKEITGYSPRGIPAGYVLNTRSVPTVQDTFDPTSSEAELVTE